VPAYTSECSGLHGHPMVAPDGTVYVPNRSCGGKQGVVVSEITVSPGAFGPFRQYSGGHGSGVNIGAGGTVYFGYQNGDGRADVAVSHDKGFTWTPSKDIGAAFGSTTQRFRECSQVMTIAPLLHSWVRRPQDPSRLRPSRANGISTSLIHSIQDKRGHDRRDATDPVQRGCIWMQGGSNPAAICSTSWISSR